MEYTPSQKKAIYTRSKSLLLSAAAGSGKTAVLVARILDIISDEKTDTNITDLLIVTFTNLAAAQMKERIYKEVSAKVKENPQNKKLKRQLLYLPGAKIKTIHSFCLDTIKENIDCLDIPVGFRIADDSEEISIKQKVLSEFTEEMYKSDNAAFFDIMNTYAYGRDDSAFFDLMISLDNFVQSIPEKEKFFEMCLNNIKTASEDFSKSIYSDVILTHIRYILKASIIKYEAAIHSGELSPDFDQYPHFFREEKAFIEKLYRETDIFKLKEMAESYSFPSIPRKKTGTDTAFFAEVRKSFKEKGYKKIIKALNCTKADEEANQKEILVHLENLFSLLKEFQTLLEAEKRRRNVLAFSDFELLAYKLLKDDEGRPSRLAENLRDSYYEILIDEYQDTSDLQNSIFNLISDGGKKLFMVGDVKQSIYKFRDARPELFIGRSEEYENDGEESELIMLRENFRSREQVIDSVNSVFSDIMTVETSKTDYKKEMLTAGLTQPEAENCNYKTEVLIYSGHKNTEKESISNEGMMIANRINSLMKSGFKVYDAKKGVHRPLEYSDIVILTRDMKDDARLIYNSLTENNIPVSGDFSGGFYERPEIMMIMSILSAIDNPYDEFALISMLKTPSFHFTETELMEIRMSDDKVPYFDALKSTKRKKAITAKQFLEKFGEKSKILSVSKLILEIYGELNMYEYISSYEAYEQRAYHLDMFYKTACEFEKNNGGNLKGFIFFLQTSSKNQKKVKNIYESKNTNSVKMLTIHKSKGLEFPVVFVADMQKSLGGKDNAAKIIMHPDIGIGTDYISPDELYVNSTLCKNAVKTTKDYEQISEELRVLYVAMTRAREKLILTASLTDADKKSAYWRSISETGGHCLYTLYESPCYLDWVMPTAEKSSFFDIDIKYENKEEYEEICEEAEEKAEIPINEAIFFEYPDKKRTELPLKVTVSYANKLHREEDNSHAVFSFDELDSCDDALSGSEYGTYFHKMFELCDIYKIKSGESVKNVINGLYENELLEYTPYSEEAEAGVEAFFNTVLGQELLKSDTVQKETSFLVKINADEIFDCDLKDEILLQGAADCWFKNDNGITLIDFKTDKNPDEEKIRKNYTKQIELYSYALEKVTGMKVTKRAIYTVRNSNIIEI